MFIEDKKFVKMNTQENKCLITFLKEFLNDFYHRVLYFNNIDDFENFEKKTIKWTKEFQNINHINLKTVVELIENHQEIKLWVSSLIGFFHQHGIGECEINKSKALELYLFTINIENKENLNDLKSHNIFVGEYLLTLYYYKKIIANKRNSFDWAIQPANNGNSLAQYQIGNCYLNGLGIEKNEKKALGWYLKSAERGNSNAQYQLGYFYEYGIGTIKDEIKAFKWYLKSAEGGNSDAQYQLGYFYQYGVEIDKDEVKAFEWYLKSAEGGNSDAQYQLGYFYQYGVGIDKDEVKALEWYLKSAKGGNSKAQYKLYLKSAEEGNSDAQYQLGYFYQYGVGIDKDEEKAFEWYLKSAKGGNFKAQYKLYLKSAEGGNSDAQYQLGYLYQYGIGIDKDEIKAFEWYLKSAEGGNLLARSCLRRK